MRYLIATDAWHPQINGVVRTLSALTDELIRRGHTIKLINPKDFTTLPMPLYSEIGLSIVRSGRIKQVIKSFGPDCIHIATEGPIGWAVRRACLSLGLQFTTGFHSRFPEMVASRLPLPGIEWVTNAILRYFHRPASRTLVPTPTVAKRLESLGYSNLSIWTRGVDRSIFQPGKGKAFEGFERPILINAGRVSHEKNLTAFLDLEVPGTKIVVGDGPYRNELEKRYPTAVFMGYKTGKELAELLRGADVFVFPSMTDTFGLVMIEALASGTPVAAFPVEGPIDIITDPRAGSLDGNLAVAIEKALRCDRADCQSFSERFSWQKMTDQFQKAAVSTSKNT